MEESPPKRRRVQRSPSPPQYRLDDEAEDYKPYVPVSQRRQEKLAKFASRGANTDKNAAQRHREQQEKEEAANEAESEREKQRRERTLLMEAQEVHSKKAAQGSVSLICVAPINNCRCKKDDRGEGR